MIQTKINKTKNVIIFILLAFLPISNVIVYYSTNVLKLPPIITIWKELLIILLMILMVINIDFKKKSNWFLLALTTILIGIGLYSSVHNNIPLNQIIVGFRFELLWILFLVVCYLTKPFELISFDSGILTGFLFVATLSILGFLVGEQNLYSKLGFQDGWGVSNQQIVGDVAVFNTPFCHSSNGGITNCRLTAGFSSANNFAGYLLLVLFYFGYKLYSSVFTKKYLYLALSFLTVIFLFLTYSRFAIVGLVLSFLIIVVYSLNSIPKNIKKYFVIILSIIPVFSVVLLHNVYENKTLVNQLPSFLTKEGSSTGHFKLTSIAVDVINRDGLSLINKGYGLSQTGPGAKSEYIDFNKSNYITKNKDIALKYNIQEYVMSVPENWYLQVILNGGWVYGLIYFVIIWLSIKGLYNKNYTLQVLLLGLFSVAVGNLYLHIWESVTVSSLYCLIYLYYKNKIDNLSIKEQIL